MPWRSLTNSRGMVAGIGFLLTDIFAWFASMDVGATVTGIGAIAAAAILAVTTAYQKISAAKVESDRRQSEARTEALRLQNEAEIQAIRERTAAEIDANERRTAAEIRLAHQREEASKGTLTAKLTEMEESQKLMRATLHRISNEANAVGLRHTEEVMRHTEEAARLTKQLDLVTVQLREANEQIRALREENKDLARKLSEALNRHTRAIATNSEKIRALEQATGSGDEIPTYPPAPAGEGTHA